MKVCIYGAGIYAHRYLNHLQEKYEIEFILDKSDAKQDTTINNIPIKKPDEVNVNLYPVIIAMRNVESGYRTLQFFNCKKDIYVLIGAGKNCYLYNYNPAVSFEDNCASVCKQGRGIIVNETSVPYIEGKRRCFDMTWRLSSEAIAGPAACVQKLFLLNEQYGLIDNLYTLWPDSIFVPKNSISGGNIIKSNKLELSFEVDEVCTSLKKYHIMYITKCIELEIIKNYWLQMNDLFSFTPSDVFLVQDNISAYALTCVFPQLKNIIAVYHSQGSLSYETKKSEPYLGGMYDAIQTRLMERCRKWVFPSKGAANSLFETAAAEIKKLRPSCEIDVVYSGYKPKEQIVPTPSLLEKIDAMTKVDITFVTATKLYYSKGVELIPAVLAQFKKQTGLSIRWILIGSGDMENEVQANLDQYLLHEDYVWYKERFPNQDDLFYIFSLADFYILMHRVSIFDLSILQAMSYGCIPFLSNVGGNLEFCAFDNGILVAGNDDELNLDRIKIDGRIDVSAVNKLKRINKTVVEQQFSYEKFLRGFKNIINKN